MRYERWMSETSSGSPRGMTCNNRLPIYQARHDNKTTVSGSTHLAELSRFCEELAVLDPLARCGINSNKEVRRENDGRFQVHIHGSYSRAPRTCSVVSVSVNNT